MGIKGPPGEQPLDKRFENDWIKESQRELLRNPEEVPQYLLELTSNEYSDDEWEATGRENAKKALLKSFEIGATAITGLAESIRTQNINIYPDEMADSAAKTELLVELLEKQEWNRSIEDVITDESSWAYQIGLFEMARIIQRCYGMRHVLEEANLDLTNIDQLIADLRTIQQYKLKQEKDQWKKDYSEAMELEYKDYMS